MSTITYQGFHWMEQNIARVHSTARIASLTHGFNPRRDSDIKLTISNKIFDMPLLLFNPFLLIKFKKFKNLTCFE